MGADKTLYLTRPITDGDVTDILLDIGMISSKQSWGWSSEMDVSLVGNKKELHLHYAYWGREHARNAHRRTKQIIRALRKKKLIKKIGRWSY